MRLLHFFFVLNLIFIGQALSAQNRIWDLDKERVEAQKQKRLDSLAIAHKQFLYQSKLYLKTEFPTQLALGYQYISQSGFSFHASTGIYPSGFTRLLLNLAENESPEAAELQQFFSDRLQNGSVNELGIGYFRLKSGVFALASLQFQKFSIATTTNELIENLDTEIDATEIESQLEEIPALEDFFYGETVYPTFRSVNLVLSAGKTFRFASMPRFSLSTHLSYGINLSSSLRVEANSFIGNTVMNNFVNPNLADSDQAIGIRGIPSLSLSLNYQFGKLIR
ncbi:MAG: hypothetical protein AAFN10_13880 [Bacteroidota bacterium]